ncbi:TetR/AcrR family transcriptional regulator [Pseudonocardia sp. HH130630-07]|uniref:TetR/AcrR family transcriptional regulator n=1 Tax=Pseudonocardia sp. HH130630-07 TaxID=1690815 RepID=UPI000814D57C|nr:TetR/AcrR family transcriptional regulator [Pseudonocardia sp. HH130630-07]ANY09362.1 TetR family transcriptional regulator [Pseudonocardia sp. HH130630-07]
MTTPLTPGARRILDTAAGLFYEHGIHAVGVDTIAARSGVTKRTLYDRFGTKDALVTAYLTERDQRWRDAVRARLDELGEPADRVLAPFDVLGPWSDGNPRGCAFVNAHAELPDPAHSARAVITGEKAWLREVFATELRAAGAADPDGVALHLLLLHEGALVTHSAAAVPDAVAAARRAAAAVRDAALGPDLSAR